MALEGVLLRRASAEIALTTSLRAAARILDPADWGQGPLATQAAAAFQDAVRADGFTPDGFRVASAGDVDPATGYRFTGPGVAGCVAYSAPWPLAETQRQCADVVDHVVP
jgi:hypothetical protein